MDRAVAGANNKNVIESIPIVPRRRPVAIYVHVRFKRVCVCV